MFIGSIDILETGHVTYPEPIMKALAYLRTHDFTKMKDGKYLIDGEKCYLNLQRYETRPQEECRPESHQKFIDIQYVVEGEEYIGWCPFNPDLKVSEAYDEKKDIAFYERLVPESNLLLQPGCFAVLFPEDVHRPQCAVDGVPALVTKVVVKIAVDLI